MGYRVLLVIVIVLCLMLSFVVGVLCARFLLFVCSPTMHYEGIITSQ